LFRLGAISSILPVFMVSTARRAETSSSTYTR
jgi:hypothetical protein